MRALGALALAGAVLGPARSGVAQEIPPVDSLAAQDTTEAARQPRRIQAFPELAARGSRAAIVWECEADCLLENPDLTLVELIARHATGLVPLRGGYFGGPHHLLDGAFGPGFVRVLVDGRELPPLESGQVDLTRISLVALERVRVVRRADETAVELSTRHHRTPVAYSRITGGTGSPGLQVLRGIFTNGLGSDFTVGAWFDLLDVREAGRSNDRLDFRGRASWMPGTNRLGIELDYGSQSVLRIAADSAEFGRREVLVRARADLSDAWQAELRLGESRWRQDASPGAGTGGEGEADAEIVRAVREVAAALSGGGAGLRGAAELRLLDADWQPAVTGRADVAWEPLPHLAVDGGVEFGSWDAFSSSRVRGGMAFSPPLPFPLRLRADAATGTRGVPRPVDGRADSVSFDAFGASAEAELGPYRAFGRLTVQRLGRQLPFGDAFDRELAIGPELEATGLEAGLEGPILPLGALISGFEPIRLRGWWRREEPEAGQPFYLPENVLHGELALHGTLFDGELEMWIVAHATRREAAFAARPGETGPVLLPAHTWPGGHFSFRVGGFRFWYKLLNPAGLSAQEVPDIGFPTAVNAVGIHWEFVN